MWYLIDSGFKDPYYNMAYDESLLDAVQDRETVFLRFFNFRVPSISIGYHQKIDSWLLDLERKGVSWVRRQTGGRAVIHSNDFTYSLVFHHDNPLIGGDVIDSYKKIALGFKRAFDKLDIPTTIQRGKAHPRKLMKSVFCFSVPSLAEIVWKRKKIIGSAQFRKKGIVLQEGTIMLKEPGSIFPRIPEMATIKEAKKGEVSLDEMKEAVTIGFEQTFHICFKDLLENPIRKELISKYLSIKWNLEGLM
ncbi:MAG: hypothetical protein U9N06_03110 [candidate division WOR-3 bacterium]|nr:hypothetical protein [candidate division WOR-3 bacterium]